RPHPHALRRNISATSSGVFITCPRGSTHDEPSVIRSSFIRSLLGYPRRGQFLVTPRGQFSMARNTVRERGSKHVQLLEKQHELEVAPRAGARIETPYGPMRGLAGPGRSPCGSADRNASAPLKVVCPAGRSPCGSADRNGSGGRPALSFCCRSPC